MIRDAIERDMPRIMEIEKDSISPPWSHGALLGEIYNEGTSFLLAFMDSAAVGFCILRCTGDEGELFQIAVAKSHRRRGFAGMLLESALLRARSSGVGTVYLEVRKSNTAAIALYKKYGFKKKGLRKKYYNDPEEDAVIMASDIRGRI